MKRDEQYYEDALSQGLDYLVYGHWQRDYARWLVSALNLKDKTVLDLGCACGSITHGLEEAGCKVYGCDIEEYMIVKGRNKWLKYRLEVCNALNLHHWKESTFDLVHCHQVFHEFKTELVPFYLAEIKRVMKPGGLLLALGRLADWWEDAVRKAGFVIGSLDRLTNAPGSFWGRYDWQGLLARKDT